MNDPIKVTIFEPDPFEPTVLKPREVVYVPGISIGGCGVDPNEWADFTDAAAERMITNLIRALGIPEA